MSWTLIGTVLPVNPTLRTRKVSSYMQLLRLVHNKIGSLSGLLEEAVSSSMIQSVLKETIRMTARKIDSVIIDVTRHHK